MTAIENTRFMDKLSKLLFQRNLLESTIKTYVRILHNINEGPFRSLMFLKNSDFVMEQIQDLQSITKQSYLSAILGVMNSFPNAKSYKTTRNKYRKLLDKIKEENGLSDAVIKKEKDKSAWMDWSSILEKRRILEEKVELFKNKRTLPMENQYQTLLYCVVISIYTYIDPRAGNQDFQEMYVVQKDAKALPLTYNYLDIEKQQFVFNKYRTINKKKTGAQIIDIPAKLMDILKVYFKFHPLLRKKEIPKEPVQFLMTSSGQPLVSVNAITRIINRITKSRISASGLRHIFLTEKFKPIINEEANTEDL